MFEQYAVVRVARLRRPDDDYDDWGRNQRSPRVGETGYLIDVLQAPNLPDRYLVESSEPDGTTIWLSEFDAEELERE